MSQRDEGVGKLRYLDVCAGISASTVAWKPLGWEAAAYSEIEAAPRAVLAHHYPGTPLHGDFTTIKGDEYGPIDLLVGGTPCQDFSVAGLRAGLDGDRGNLSLEFLRLADRTRPRWVVWENVPGVLSIDGGRAFGAILGGLGELGYGFAYRVLDAQFFGVPQRRRRVFVVGCAGDWRGAAAVLSERHSLSGHPAPRRQKGEGSPGFASIGAGEYGAGVGSLRAKGADCGGGSETLIAHALRGEGFDASEDGTGRGTPLVPVHAIQAGALRENPNSGPDGIGVQADCAYTLEARSEVQAVAFMENQRGELRTSECANLTVGGGKPGQGYPAALQGSAVRRLTPRECERLQGFPDDRNTVTIRVCQNEEEKRAIASSVPQDSTALSHDQSVPVAVCVLIDLERPGLLLHSLGRSPLSVSDVGDTKWSALPIPADAFVRLAALMTSSLARATRAGRGASLRNIRGSSPLWNGSASVLLCGREIERLAADAEMFMSVAKICTTFTMSEAGPISPTTEQDLEILSSCVSAAIAGFIPATIRQASSYAVQIEVVGGYTLVPHRGKPMADGPRYKALGNSMAVPVMRWIGQRIAAVEGLQAERIAA